MKTFLLIISIFHVYQIITAEGPLNPDLDCQEMERLRDRMIGYYSTLDGGNKGQLEEIVRINERLADLIQFLKSWHCHCRKRCNCRNKGYPIWKYYNGGYPARWNNNNGVYPIGWGPNGGPNNNNAGYAGGWNNNNGYNGGYPVGWGPSGGPNNNNAGFSGGWNNNNNNGYNPGVWNNNNNYNGGYPGCPERWNKDDKEYPVEWKDVDNSGKENPGWKKDNRQVLGKPDGKPDGKHEGKHEGKQNDDAPASKSGRPGRGKPDKDTEDKIIDWLISNYGSDEDYSDYNPSRICVCGRPQGQCGCCNRRRRNRWN